MPNSNVNVDALYREVITWLQGHNASGTADDIRNCVAKGVVVTQQQQSIGKVVRPMDDHERMAVVLEFLVSLLEPPLYLHSARHILNCQEIRWEPDELSAPSEPVAAPTYSDQEIDKLKSSLQRVIGIAAEMGIALPEIA
jgi:hypothetical protein